jgi:hypothetical protein
MRKYLPLLILVITLSLIRYTYAQEPDPGNGAFGATSIKVTKMLGQSAAILGGRFGWVLDDQFVLGGGVYALAGGVNANFIDPVSGEEVRMNFNYGGLQLEYIFLAQDVVHASIDVLISGAGTYYSVPDQSKPHTSYFTQSFTIYEPEINLEFTLLNWLHLDASGSYRFVTGFDNNFENITANDIQGFSGILTFRFGSY